MNKKDRVNYIIETLELLFPEVPIPLDHKDPYTLLIAVLLSAQSTDVGVNKITPLLFSKADNPFDMIKLSIDEIRQIIKPVGLSPMKSKGIYGLSKILIDKHDGKVPKNFEDLEALPSVGHEEAHGSEARKDGTSHAPPLCRSWRRPLAPLGPRGSEAVGGICAELPGASVV